MEITYELRPEDYIAFNLRHIEQSPSQRRIYRWTRILLPLAGSLISFFVGTRLFNQPEIFWAVFSLLLMIGIWFYYPKVHRESITKQVMRLLEEGDNSTLFGAKKLTIRPEHIEISDAHSTSHLTRQNIKEIKEYPDQIILYLSAVQGVIVPKRHLDLKTQQQLIKALTLFQNGGE